MNCEHSKTFLDYLTAFGPLVVAIAVAYIAYRQFRTNADKLRLDLYDRRFAVYVAALDFYVVLSKRKGRDTDEFIKAQGQFIKAIRESSFLFGFGSATVAKLEEIRKKADDTSGFDTNGMQLKASDSQEYWKWHEKAMSNVFWISGEDGLMELERTMAPYLDFRNAASGSDHGLGWLNSCRVSLNRFLFGLRFGSRRN